MHAFVSIGTNTYHYDHTCPVVLPPWAPSSMVNEGDETHCSHFGGDQVLNPADRNAVHVATSHSVHSPPLKGHALHARKPAWNVPDTHMQSGAEGGGDATFGHMPARYDFVMPVDGTTLYATCEHLHPLPIRKSARVQNVFIHHYIVNEMGKHPCDIGSNNKHQKYHYFWRGRLQLPPHTHSHKAMALPLHKGVEDMDEMIDLAQVNGFDVWRPGIVLHKMIA